MDNRVGLGDLNRALNRLLTQYGDETAEQMAEIVPKAARKAAKTLRETSKLTFDGSGRYAKGWTARTEKGRLRTTATVYNKDLPGLAHLLEHGHANRGGGRTPGWAHIAPVEEAIVEAFRKEVEGSL